MPVRDWYPIIVIPQPQRGDKDKEEAAPISQRGCVGSPATAKASRRWKRRLHVFSALTTSRDVLMADFQGQGVSMRQPEPLAGDRWMRPGYSAGKRRALVQMARIDGPSRLRT